MRTESQRLALQGMEILRAAGCTPEITGNALQVFMHAGFCMCLEQQEEARAELEKRNQGIIDRATGSSN